MNASEVLLRPVLTEKTTEMQESGRYTFEVARAATKLQGKRAVEEAFDVDVVKVNTMNVKGKRKRFGPKFVAQRPRKKAVVTIASGQSITIFEGV